MRIRLGSRSRTPEEGPAHGGAISRRIAKGGRGCMAAFFSVFLLAGLGFSLFFLVPAYRVLQARTWTAVPCTVLSSEVTTHTGDDGDTYSVEVRYAYEVDGVRHTSDRYQFLGGSSSGYEGKAEVVARLPAGTRTTCWVDPDDPGEAVLERGFGWAYLFALLPLVFVAVGAGGIGFALLGGRRARTAGRLDWLPEPRAEPDAALAGAWGPASASGLPPAGFSGPVTLKARLGRVGRFVGILFVAAFWNGITGLFVWKAVEGWRAGAGDGCLTIFLIPFVAVGLLLLSGVPYQFLALFNPRLTLTLSSASVPPGGTAQLSWRFSGLAGRIRELRILLEGREEATYVRGTTTHTDKEVFARLPVAETRDRMEIASGARALTLPEDTMHSFSAPHNKVVWTLKVEGDIRLWPDVTEEFDLVVPPRGAGA